jgi:hypothetical protein
MFPLTYHIEQGLNFLNNCVDKKRGCLPYFAVMFKNDPAEVRHDWPDFGDLTGRYVEAFVLARQMLKIKEPFETELALRKLLLSYFNEGDGLSYRPKPVKPYYSTIFRRDYDAHVAEGFDQARVLWSLMAWYDDSKDKEVFRRIEELLVGLDRLVIKRDDYCYYDRSTFNPGVVPDQNAEPMPHQYYFCGTQIHPLIECYNRYSNEQAGQLAKMLTNFIICRSDYFLQDGTWNCPGGGGFESAEMDGHTHSRFATIAGITHVGISTGQRDLVFFMKRCYDWFVTNHCSSSGWSPEFLGRLGDSNEGCETCAVMDQLNCCFAFTKAGFTEYYEQAEKIARNQLVENQLLDTSLVRNTIDKEDTDLSCFHNVATMVRGGFAGWAAPNDFIGNCDHHYCLMNCCGPAGIRALYDVWDNIYNVKNDSVYINIFVDREIDQISMKNLILEKGLIILDTHKSVKLYLACRSWVQANTIKVKINGEFKKIELVESYVDLGFVQAGSRIEVELPISLLQESVYINGRNYKFKWLGDTVMAIDPPGQKMPFYKNRNS